MKQLTKIFTLFLFITAPVIKGQIGVPPTPYCYPMYNNVPCNQPNPSNTAGNSINDFIDSFNTTGAAGNITNNNTGCNTQVLNTTSTNYFFVACPQFLRVTNNQVVTCNFLSGIIFNQGFAVFVDWNKDNTLNDAGEMVCGTPGVPPAATWSSAAFTVPNAATAPAGTYRMRVRCAYATTGTTIRPCQNYGFGEVEDYRLVVGTSTLCPVLPVNLVSYEGYLKNNVSELAWITSTEHNSDYFLIERSYDLENFEFVTKVPASVNSNIEQYYTASDKNVKNNRVVYYRLKQFDKGNSEPVLEKTISIYSNNKNLGFDVFPNPASTEVKLVMPDVLTGTTLQVSVFDNLGRKVIEKELINDVENINHTLNISELAKGTYYIRINNLDVNVNKILIKE